MSWSPTYAASYIYEVVQQTEGEKTTWEIHDISASKKKLQCFSWEEETTIVTFSYNMFSDIRAKTGEPSFSQSFSRICKRDD